MATVAPYEPERFASTVPYYAEGRPAYAPALLERLARETGLGPHSRVLDLGCGPGSLTLPLSRLCGTMIGIDPDRSMIEAARARAEADGLAIDWRVGSSYDLGDDLAPLDVVTIARAFHWMDRIETLKRLDDLIAPGGAVALVNTELHSLGASRWHSVFEELRKAHGRFDAFYRMRKSDAWESRVSVLLRSAFADVVRISTFEVRTTDIEEVVARAFSFSANSRSVLGEEASAAYEREVRTRMMALEPSGRFPEVVESVAFVARRQP